MDVQFVKDVAVQFSSAFFGATFAVIVALSGQRFSRFTESNQRYRDELVFLERYYEFLVIQIDLLIKDVENVYITISKNRTEDGPNVSYNLLASLPTRDFTESKLLDIDALNEIGNINFRVRRINSLVENWNQIHAEMRQIVATHTLEAIRLNPASSESSLLFGTLKQNLLNSVQLHVGLMIELRSLKKLTLEAEARILGLLKILPKGGMLRFAVFKFSKYKPTEAEIKEKLYEIISRHIRG